MTEDDILAYEELFSRKGWKNLMEQAEQEIQMLQITALEDTNSFDQVCVLRGRAQQLQNLLSLEQQVQAMIDLDSVEGA